MSYPKPDPNALVEWSVKTYSCAELISEVCDGMKLAYHIHKPDLQESFVVFHIQATQKDFRDARFQWLARMTVSIPQTKELHLEL